MAMKNNRLNSMKYVIKIENKNEKLMQILDLLEISLDIQVRMAHGNCVSIK